MLVPGNVRLAFLLALSIGIIGCTANCRFYPVQGPLAAQVPPPVLAGKFTAHPHERTLTGFVVLSDGERAVGTLMQEFPPLKRGSAPTQPMSTQWDSVYGQGSYTATVLGQGQDARGTLKSSNGTSVNVELHYNTPAAGPLQGVAQDDKGNLYKVAF
jgi:hypothetical protein